ncbi:pentatricopeptide repeat-containing protein At4g14820 [Diospyros lotus]|uniref:pentatricopeptide repeat-containing protein At4g14820 n=1 Tax=Diospyros lotus TaxID=55363 RepID=UPI002251329F|nr:pentatricopeptide repeat-containing protein At4g14820 [Diospyros lotus]XP_052191487.1 pentatricopeptide repeat-containing protein At4g14820 [Diospyros lotus]XP_052191488.1 pentatricopeptide repeat-containing protein At4g14820 [Diospyros lotus]
MAATATMTQPITTFPPHPNPTIHHHNRHSHLLSALSSATSISHLKQLHAQILRSGLDRSTSLLLKLAVSSCALSRSSLPYALSVFAQIPRPQTRISNSFLRELSRSSEPESALFLFEKLLKEGLRVDRFSFPALLKASSRVQALMEGMEIHGLGVKLGFDSDPFVQTAVVRMYAACGRISDARMMFEKMSHRDVVTWSIMIDGYSQSGLFDDVLMLFEEMKRSDVEPDEMILSTVLSACGRAGNLNCGKAIHELITEKDMVLDSHLVSALITMYSSCGSMELAQDLYDQLSSKNVVVSTAMVSGYSKLGKVEAARLIFDQIDEKDLVCWSAMISGYAESEHPQEALDLFNEMQVLGIKPDHITMLSVVSACANLGALEKSKWIHKHVDKYGFSEALSISNALIDMYAKCGSLEGAREVFNRMHRRNVITWTSMISAFAMHGDAANSVKLFNQMKAENIQPNGVTFVSVLYACSHAGLVDEGQKIFASMVNEYNIVPKHEHYGCMVDLFGRANLLREALELVEQMPLAPNVVIWGSLMAACRVHKEVELGEFAAKRLLDLEPNHDGAHVLLSNIYAKERRWEDVREVRRLMKHKGVFKERGCSRLELNNEIHEFLMADRSHKQADEIYAKLDEVVGDLKLVGYAPNTCDVLVDVNEDEKEEMVLWHSEKLALCYGLMKEEEGSSIHIVKNLRICEDCHDFMKLVSKVYQRNIIVRDRTRFHHYKDGKCSCKDYW